MLPSPIRGFLISWRLDHHYLAQTGIASQRAPPILAGSLIALAGFAAGFLDVLAGGGLILVRPALVAAGLSVLGAEASGMAALVPAELVTAFLLRAFLRSPRAAPAVSGPTRTGGGVGPWALATASVAGGFVGAVILLLEPPGSLAAVEPWLILFAIGAVAGGDTMAARMQRFGLGRRGTLAVQVSVALYGGYLGGGIGFMVSAALSAFGIRDIRAMTALKIALMAATGAAAALAFATAGLIQWQATITLAVAALSGGLAGVEVAKRVPASALRAVVLATGAVLTLALLRFGPA